MVGLRSWVVVVVMTAVPVAALGACGASNRAAPPRVAGEVMPDTPDSVNIVKARESVRERAFDWAPYSAESFARAKKERRFILIDGAAEWCHWCHVMDETTYRDPDVGRILRERFVAIRVDIDERPDLAERWADWGWPATILLTPEAEEIGKFRGYLQPEKMRATLGSIEKSASRDAASPDPNDPDLRPSPVDALPWVGARVARDLDAFYDPEQGGWGMRQKAPIGPNIEIDLRRAAKWGGKRAGQLARERATFTLQQQRSVIDPVWGGVYQYSAASDWKSPHFEKLITVQAAQIEAYARGFQATKDASFLADARSIVKYMETFLGAPDGTFYVNQDADAGAHDRAVPFVDGHVFYAKDDAARRALGMPWVDTHVYGRENGLAIAALCTLHEVGGDPAPLTRARKAADAIIASHVLDDGTVVHDANRRTPPYFLADSAAFGRALTKLAALTGDASYREKALKVAAATIARFEDPGSGGLFEATVDPAAAGVFARRERSFAHNVVAARFFASLARVTANPAWRERAKKVLAAVASPRALDDQGRFLGEFLIALDEAEALGW